MMPWARAAHRSCADPGRAAYVQTSWPAGPAMTCTFTPWRWCLPEYGFWSATRSIGIRGAVEDRVGQLSDPVHRRKQVVGGGCKQVDGFVDVAPGGAHADPDTAGQLSQDVAVAQVGQGEQGLASRVEPPATGSALVAVLADETGEVVQVRVDSGFAAVCRRKSRSGGRIPVIAVSGRLCRWKQFEGIARRRLADRGRVAARTAVGSADMATVGFMSESQQTTALGIHEPADDSGGEGRRRAGLVDES
jgi:hypothetical protein